jgi:hypothetical protein
MDATLSITTAASDRTLLSRAEQRDAVGASDAKRDAELAVIEARVAAAIAVACGLPRAGASPLTLRAETVAATWRLSSPSAVLAVTSRPIVSVSSLTVDGTELATTDYEIDHGAGMIRRLSGDDYTEWSCGKVVMTAVVGWSDVPQELKLAAAKFMAAEWTQGARDPMLKRVSIDGISEREYWVDPTKDSTIPAEVMDILRRGGFVHMWV